MTHDSCVFCLKNKILNDEQILLRGEYLYLCAPLGQITEGYLIISPYSCNIDIGSRLGCLSSFNKNMFSELIIFKNIVKEYYKYRYGNYHPVFYEQGRAGGDKIYDTSGRFPHHAHFCGVPKNLNIHSILSSKYEEIKINSISEIVRYKSKGAYILVDSYDKNYSKKISLYTSYNELQEMELEKFRLKPIIFELEEDFSDPNWRLDPEENKMLKVISTFSTFIKNKKL